MGGGTSGQVGYPAYIEAIHANWLSLGPGIIVSVTDAMNVAFGNNPYTGMVAYDTAPAVADVLAAVTDFDTLLGTLFTDLQLTEAEITGEVDAYRGQTDAELLSTVLPRFQGGMRSVNAVHSSAFVIGQAILEDGQSRDVNKFHADLRLKSRASGLEVATLRGELESKLAALVAEANKFRVIGEKTTLDHEQSLDVSDAKWDLEVFQYGGNLMAAPSGAGVNTKPLVDAFNWPFMGLNR